MRISFMSDDEKKSIKDNVETPTGAGITPAPNVTRFISEKLLDWGVEERGTYRLTSRHDRP